MKMSLSEYTTNIKALVENGRAEELRKLMEGESEYTSPESELVLENIEVSKVWRMALEHVRFVSEFGLNKNKVEIGNHFYSSYPDDFEKWLEIGAPGLPKKDFEAYILEKPIKSK
jgi:hypothetical protein